MADFNTAFQFTLSQEGSYQNLNSDPGNVACGVQVGTKYGVSAQGYYQYYKTCPTVSDMQNLTVDQAKTIAKQQYWDAYIRGDEINNNAIGQICFEIVWGSGGSGLKQIRKAINDIYGAGTVSESSSPTQLTDDEISLINNADPTALGNALYNERSSFYNNLGGPFVQGWMNRLNALFDNVSQYLVTTEQKNPGLLIAVAGVLVITAIIVYIEIKKRK